MHRAGVLPYKGIILGLWHLWGGGGNEFIEEITDLKMSLTKKRLSLVGLTRGVHLGEGTSAPVQV